MQITKISHNSIKGAVQLIGASGLPTSDLTLSNSIKLFAITHNNKTIASCGLEIFKHQALLRSLAVAPEFRNQGLGLKIYQHTINQARNMGLKNLFLLTTTADNWFLKQGWKVIDRSLVKGEITQSAEFSSLCPQSAVCMHLML